MRESRLRVCFSVKFYFLTSKFHVSHIRSNWDGKERRKRALPRTSKNTKKKEQQQYSFCVCARDHDLRSVKLVTSVKVITSPQKSSRNIPNCSLVSHRPLNRQILTIRRHTANLRPRRTFFSATYFAISELLFNFFFIFSLKSWPDSMRQNRAASDFSFKTPVEWHQREAFDLIRSIGLKVSHR